MSETDGLYMGFPFKIIGKDKGKVLEGPLMGKIIQLPDPNDTEENYARERLKKFRESLTRRNYVH